METFYWLLALCEGIHWSPVVSHHKGQWRGALMFSLICVRTKSWANNGDTGDLRRHRDQYDVSKMQPKLSRINKSMSPLWKDFNYLWHVYTAVYKISNIFVFPIINTGHYSQQFTYINIILPATKLFSASTWRSTKRASFFSHSAWPSSNVTLSWTNR